PVLNGIRVPARFAVVAVTALDVLLATTLAALLRQPGRWWSLAWVAVLAVLVVEFLPGPLDQRPVDVPAPYGSIAASSDPRAVLEIPTQWSLGARGVGDRAADRDDSQFLYYPLVHHRPVVSGTTSRYPDERLQRLLAIPAYRQILALQGDPGFADAPAFTADDLCRLGIGFVAYHRDRPVEAVREYME